MELISITLCVKVVVVENCESAESKCHSGRGDACENNCLVVAFTAKAKFLKVEGLRHFNIHKGELSYFSILC